MKNRNFRSSDSLLQKRQIFLSEWSEIGLSGGGEILSADLTSSLHIAVIVVRVCSCGEVAQVVLREMRHTTDFLLFFISRIIRHLLNIIYRWVFESAWIRPERLLLINAWGRGFVRVR